MRSILSCVHHRNIKDKGLVTRAKMEGSGTVELISENFTGEQKRVYRKLTSPSAAMTSLF